MRKVPFNVLIETAFVILLMMVSMIFLVACVFMAVYATYLLFGWAGAAGYCVVAILWVFMKRKGERRNVR